MRLCAVRNLLLQRPDSSCCSSRNLHSFSSLIPCSPRCHGDAVGKTIASGASRRDGATVPFSSPADSAANPDALKQRMPLPLSVTRPHVIFPWRHEDSLLPRLIPGTKEDIEQGRVYGPGLPFPANPYMRFAITVTAGNKLQVPWYRILGSEWKQELADSCGWAFSQAVCAVLSNTYHVPFDECSDSSGVNFRHKTHSHENKDDQEGYPDVEYMLETNLRDLYDMALKTGKDQMQITLQSKVTSAHLHSIFWNPISRSAAEKQPALRLYWSKLLEEISNYPGEITWQEVREIGLAKGTEIGELAMERYHDRLVWASNIVVQVLVHCEEVFLVTDVKTGAVVQGHADGKIRPVTHLVRMEQQIEKHYLAGGRVIDHLGSWQITDWDDLLGGNLY